MAKYKVTKTDIFLGGQVIPEESIIDSKKYSEEDIESVKHLLILVDETTPVTMPQPETKTASTTTTTNVVDAVKPKRSRNPK